MKKRNTSPKLPERVDFRRAAALISELFFPVSHRTIPRWPLAHLKVNGKNTLKTSEVVDYAKAMLEAAEEKQARNLTPHQTGN